MFARSTARVALASAVCTTPVAVAPRRKASLYLCTDARRERGDLAEFADAALAGGVDIIQLRGQGLARRAAVRAAGGPPNWPPSRCWPTRRADMARCWRSTTAPISPGRAGADVLHLGQDDLPLSIARDIIGPRPLIGRSTHDHGPGRRRGRGGGGLLLRRPVLAHPDQAGPTRARSGPGPRRRRIAQRQAVVRDRRHRRAAAARGARRGRARIVVVRAITAADDPRPRRNR